MAGKLDASNFVENIAIFLGGIFISVIGSVLAV